MPLARIPLKSNNENKPPIALKHKTLDNKENKLSQLIHSHNTIRQGGNSSRTVIKPRKPLGKKSVNTIRPQTTTILKDNLKQSKENMNPEHDPNKQSIPNLKEEKNTLENSTLKKLNQQSLKIPKEPTISFALPVSKPSLIGSDIFAHIDTPVHTLPTDCLVTIFEYCKDFETYCALLAVCRRWRHLAAQPFLWKNTNFKWTTFSKQIDLLHHPRRRFEQFQYIRKLTIQHQNKTVIRNPLTDIVSITPFKRLKELHLLDMDLTDISFLVSWLKNIKVLHCKNTHISRGRINFSIFSDLNQLEDLEIHCAEPCPFGQTAFTLLRHSMEIGSFRKLPRSLKHLSIQNVYDCEEILDGSASRSSLDYETYITSQSLDRQERMCNHWLQFDDQLVSKYQMLQSLTNLRSLMLGRVSAFTSRVWRECLIPCAKNLEYVSLHTWEGGMKRESPQRILDQHRRRTEDALPVYDVEIALSEFISSLKKIKKINLDQFTCGDGVIMGLNKLGREYSIRFENSVGHNNIGEYKGVKLLDVDIEFSDE